MIEILMATYNGEAFVAQQIESILAQTFKDWQLLIRDDGSQDSTLDICAKYSVRYPDRIRLLKDGCGNLGVNQNYAALLRQASSPYIMFCDQDDVWFHDKIQSSFEALRQKESEVTPNKPIVVYTDMVVTNRELEPVCPSVYRYTHRDPHIAGRLGRHCMANCTFGCSMMINRALRDLSLSFPDGIIMWDWWISMIAAVFGHLVFLDRTTMYFRRHGKNRSTVHSFNVRRFLQWRSLIMGHRYQLNRIFMQHRRFFETFESSLTGPAHALFYDAGNLPSKSWFMRRFLLLKHRMFKTGLAKNVGLFITV